MSVPHKRRFWAWPAELRRAAILGINARNLALVGALNPRALYPRLDDKVLTKALCGERGIPVPDTYAVIERFGEIRRLPELLDGRQEFVIKPARGAGGRGVLVIVRETGSTFHTSKGTALPLSEVQHHVSTTLSGLYSLGGRPDRAIIEQRICPHPAFQSLAVGGTPDIRILVYRFAPIMAMLRLPTAESGGRANLHRGAVGAGIDMTTGRTCGGVHHSRAIDVHPDTAAVIAGNQLPFWEESLAIAGRLGQALEAGYIGVDVVLDADRGPVALEANTRPGLAIQIANRRGLLTLVGT
jgi:alpha-L-glutamate ligase-like protein